jgi:oxygen-independent coproporphyrinogen-3 oxidase
MKMMVKEIMLFSKEHSQKETFENSPMMMSSENIETIYFGGGTPSLMTFSEIMRMIDTVRSHFTVDKNAEITLEANPDDINETNLKGWKLAGVNRLSLGVQSFIKRDLEWMNRAHNSEQALNSISLIKNAGFENFSIDLIYGTPGLDTADWKKNLQTAIDLKIPHLSCYALTVEPNTPLKKMIHLKKRENVDAEIQSIQFLLMVDELEKAGYEHYEISNFALPGARSKHNSGYWQGKSYFGFGPSAHSFYGNKRSWNVSNNELYIQSILKDTIPSTHEVLTSTQQLNEYIMTAVRTSEGLDLELVIDKYGTEKAGRLKELMFKFQASGKARIHDSKIILTKEGKLFADGIAADLFFEEQNLVS